MNQLDKKKEITELVKKCIGDRSITAASMDTGLSRNKLQRLKTGVFAKIPPLEDFAVLTNKNANPQNGVVLDDFKRIIEMPAIQIDKATRKKNSEMIEARFLGIIISYLNQKYNSYTIVNKSSDTADLTIVVDGLTYCYDFIHMSPYIVNPDKFSKVIDSHILKAVKMKICNGYNIVCNNHSLYEAMINMNWNIGTKANVILVDYDTFSVVESFALN